VFCVWHDLRKNPKELPAEDMLCIILYEDEYHKHVYAVAPYMSDVQIFVTYKHVLAWTRLDMFDEEHSCSTSYLDEQIKDLRSYLNMHKVSEELVKKLKVLLYYLSGE
jgi:alpha-D-ribose 1-methylphosphonate 5-phosphate C-P lyase